MKFSHSMEENEERGGPSCSFKTGDLIGETSKKGTKNMEQKKNEKNRIKRVACLSKTKKNTKKMSHETEEVGVMGDTREDCVIDIDPDGLLNQLSDLSDSETVSYVAAAKEFFKQLGKDIIEGCKQAVVEAIKKNILQLIEEKVFKRKGKNAKSSKAKKECV